jgi:amino acid adenylation domain-containing protein
LTSQTAASELLARLRSLDISVSRRNGSLRLDAPTGRLSQGLLAEVREHKQGLLALVREHAATEAGDSPTHDPSSPVEYPIAPAQHALFIMDRIASGERAHGIVTARRIHTAVDPSVLGSALRWCVGRHEAMRTTFSLRDGRPIQTVAPRVDCAVEFEDCSALGPGERDRALERRLAEARSRPFVLSTGPLFHLVLLRLGPEDHVLVSSFHHIIVDASSLDIFYADLLTAYQAFAQGREPDVPPIREPYGAYSARMARKLDEGALSSDVDFWKRELADLPDLAHLLGADRAAASTACRTAHGRVDPVIARALHAIAEQAGVSVFAVLLGAFQVVLRAHTGSSDVPVLVMSSTRERSGARGVLGMFLSTVVVRGRIQSDDSLLSVFRQAQERTAAAVEHQDVSIDMLEGMLRGRRDRSVALERVGRIAFNYIAGAGAKKSAPGMPSIDPIEVNRTHATFDLMLIVAGSERGLEVKLEYREHFVSEALAEGLVRRFTRALGEAIRDATAPIARVSLVDDQERDSLLAGLVAEGDVVGPLPDRVRRLLRASREAHAEFASAEPAFSVLGIRRDLASDLTADTLREHATALARETPELRSAVLRSPDRALGAALWRTRTSVDPAAFTAIDLDDADPHAEDRALGAVAAAIAPTFTVTPWRAVLVRQRDRLPRLWVIASNAVLDRATLRWTADALVAACNGRETPARGPGTKAYAEPEPGAPAQGEAVTVVALSPCELPPDSTDDEEQRWPGEESHFGLKAVASATSLCEAHGLKVGEVVRAAFALVVALRCQPEGSFALKSVGLDATAPVGEADGTHVVFPSEDEWADATFVDFLRASREVGSRALTWAASADGSARAFDYVFEWDASNDADAFPAAWVPEGTARLTARFSGRALRAQLARAGHALPDPRALKRIESILEQVSANPRMRDLRLALADELTGGVEFPRFSPVVTDGIHREIERSAAQHPHRGAVEHGEVRLTYSELNTAANRVARQLGASGVRPGESIGVYLPRNEYLVPALLGILKRGCAYLPIDRRYPPRRVQRMLEMAGCKTIVTAPELAPDLEGLGTPLLLLDTSPASSLDARELASERVTGDDAAYVMFTSGSTGSPKGVVVPHGAVVGFLRSVAQRPGLASTDRLLAVTTIAFDISVLELFLPLLVGGTVRVAGDGAVLDPAGLARELDDRAITAMQATPHVWRILLDAGWKGRPAMTALCGGEALPGSLAEKLVPCVAALWNMYGPTEATVWATAHPVVTGTEPIPLGQALDNTFVRVLDRLGRVLPPEVPGEIVIGGSGLALGYANAPDETARRFVARSGAAGESIRIYRTGDRGIQRTNGALLFRGRIDRQVKLRGFRIELTELEAHIRAVPGVAEAVAVLRADAGADGDLVAYVEAPDASGVTVDQVRAALKASVPAYAMPQYIVRLAELPRLANGKVDVTRVASLPRPAEHVASSCTPATELEATVAKAWTVELGHANFGPDDNFFDVGGQSLITLRLHKRLEHDLRLRFDVVDLFTHPTIRKLAAHLEGRMAKSVVTTDSVRAARPREVASRSSHEVAIVGMACRFPGAADIHAFWRNLCRGVESIARLDGTSGREGNAANGTPNEWSAHPDYVPAAAVLPDVEMFDAAFFQLSPKEAMLLDPQHRLLLECTFEALEDAGYDPLGYEGRIGLFAGAGFSYYLLQAALTRPQALANVSPLELLYASDKDYAATRVAYKLGLRGPCLTVGTACSTGLVAVHQACQAIAADECEMAIAAAARIVVPQRRGYLYARGGILSRDGHCRAFDASATGTVFGSGGGAVVLKRLDRALRDRDAIYAVVKGSAVNNDGRDKVGFTAPSVGGQVQVIRDALRAAHVDPETIQYVEAHGAGTAVGDAIELTALGRVLADAGSTHARIAIGSVKSNVGHLDTAAGMAGLIKATLSVHHAQIPPSLHVEEPNPSLASQSTLYVNTSLQEWETGATPRRAGVSSFGIGGTNAHVVLEAASDDGPPSPSAEDAPQLLLLSAESPTMLVEYARRVAERLRANPSERLLDVAHTLREGRRARSVRLAVVARTPADAAALLEKVTLPQCRSAGTLRSGVVVACPGPMGRIPHAAAQGHFAPLRRTIEECLDVARASGGETAVLTVGDLLEGRAQSVPALRRLTDFAFQYAIGRELASLGCPSSGFAGFGWGELVAACLAGVLELSTAVQYLLASGDDLGSHATLAASVRTGGSRLFSCSGSAWLSEADLRSAESWRARLCAAPLAALRRSLREAGDVVVINIGETGGLDDALRSALGEPPDVLSIFGPDADDPEVSLRTVLGHLWTRGHTLSAMPEAAAAARRVHLPPHPFDRQPHWIPEGDGAATTNGSPTLRRTPTDSWAYEPSWVRRQLVLPADRPTKTVLVIGDLATPSARPVVDALTKSGHTLVLAQRARRFAELVAGRRYELDAADPAQVKTLFSLVAREQPLPERLMFLASTGHDGEPDAPGAALDGLESFRSLLGIGRELAALRERPEVLLAVLTRDAHRVLGDERVDPGQALVHGPCAVLPLEIPGLRCATIDVTGDASPGDLARSIAAEFDAGLPCAAVALRAGHRWTRTFERVTLPPIAAPKTPLRPVVLITGGCGGIGRALARHLASTRGARIVLTGRRPPADVPEQELRAIGADVSYRQADVADAAALSVVIQECFERFGHLSGIVHAAGVADGRLVAFRDREHDERVLAPKVTGTLALLRALGNRHVDFLVLCSSISSVVGDPGQVAYVSANAFLDALADSRPRPGCRTVSVNWDAWSQTGMATRTETPQGLETLRSTRLALGIRTSEGLDLFDRVLAADMERVIISTTDLPARLAGSRRIFSGRPTQPAPAESAVTEPGASAASLEEALCAAWKESLGVARVSPESDYFALGGSSLQAVHLIDSVRRRLGVDLRPDDLLRCPTPKALAAALEARRAEPTPSPVTSFTRSDRGGTAERCVVSLRTGQPDLEPLILIHPIGGEVFVYRDLAHSLRTRRPIVAIRADDVGAQRRTVEDLANDYIDFVRPLARRGPHYLCGSSFGGTIAYEMAQKLRASGTRIGLLCLIDTPHPTDLGPDLSTEVDVLAYLASHLPESAGLSRSALSAVPAADLLTYFADRVRAAGMPEPIDADVVRRYVDVFRANSHAMRGYVPKPHAGPLLYVEALERRPNVDPIKPSLAWHPLAAPTRVVPVPGNHVTLHYHPHVTELAAILDAALAVDHEDGSRARPQPVPGEAV